MIERKILYYPTILTPSRWLKWAILYWDKASSVMPYGWEDDPKLASSADKECYKIMRDMWTEQAYEPTRPGDLWLDAPRIGRILEDEFREIVSSVKFKARLNKKWKKKHAFRIHRDKVANRTLAFLSAAGLAEIDKSDREWFFAEENTSLLYMGLLAKHLADIDFHDTVPSTDWAEYETTIFGSEVKENGFPSFKVELTDVLPIPQDDATVKDILKFKREGESELFRLRKVMDEFHNDISNAKNDVTIKRILVKYKEKIENGRSDLCRLMKGLGVKTTFAAIRSLISIKSPALYETIGYSIAQTPLAISAPIIAGTAFVQVGYAWIANRNKRVAELRKSPFSYLYHAQQEKLI